MASPRAASATMKKEKSPEKQSSTELRFHGVRYQVKDVSRSISFYSEHLGFKVTHQKPPAFATLSLGPLDLLLSGPGASGSRPMPGGRSQEPGGSNRGGVGVAGFPVWTDNV